MKSPVSKGFRISLAVALSILMAVVYSSVAFAESWNFVDGNGTNGINVDPTKNAGNPKMVDFNGTMFAAWSESIGSTSQIRVKQYDHGSWGTGDNDTPLNKDTTKDALNVSLVVFNNELYATWQELGPTSYWQLRVAKYNGTSWSRVDGDGTSGINTSSNTNARNPKLIEYNSSLYVFWDETGGNGINQIRVKKYAGGSTWNSADGGSSLNQNSSHAGQAPSAVVYNGKLYLTWQENDNSSISQLRIKSYDGTTWSFVDGGGASGLNYNTAMRANAPALAVYNGELYVAWCEQSTKTQLRVKKYDGTNWVLVDGGQSTGLNQNTNYDAYQARLAVFDGNLYATWHEGSPNYHVRVKKYDGISWGSADGNSTKGLNNNTSYSATYGYLVEFDSALYDIFLENNGANQVRVVQMGPSNAAPTAANVIFTGTLKEGNTLTGAFAYGDLENDPMGTTIYKWYIADDAAGTNKTVISGATTSSLSLTHAQAGKYIIFEVTPVATAGTQTGTPTTYTSASAVLANEAPTASSVSFTGTLKEGNTLTGAFAYGDLENDPMGTTIYKWYIADDAAGTNKTVISGATTSSLSLTHAEAGKYIIFEVTPVATAGTQTGTPVSYTSLTEVGANAAPIISDLMITGDTMLNKNKTLTATYTYSDMENDLQSGSTYRWYTADDMNGPKQLITGEVGTTLQLSASMYNKYIIFEVTPGASTGTTPGDPVQTHVGPIGVLKGDANGDGQVTPADSLFVNKIIQGKVPLTDELKFILDVNNDGKVDAVDAKLILDIYLGKGV
ncbi:dockerin type I domain-containing protein [Paenibacillus hexagrammi]|uniref:Dockerin type I repeat-containing protein n=1 Tax=Paenibacillus hexagrammi TaxID=2908839 RepID=A0ABY3SH34_9BACL|nr:dockerin type I domain-containing protein [Paenibacillus sp. YPD9-1]UJF32511.1 dockerin type I repeat-containing protein [Paenibacillus sp. YPD9-1]